MISPDIIDFIVKQGPYLVVKILVVILLLIHLVFSIVVLRQTKLMIKVVEANITSFIYLVSLTHLLASIFVLVWTILFL